MTDNINSNSNPNPEESQSHSRLHVKPSSIFVDALLADRRSDRRWRNFRFFVWVFIILGILALIFAPSLGKQSQPTQNYVSVVRMTGTIMPEAGFSAGKIIPQLNDAFSDEDAKGVVLIINSPGGSPVQSSIIHDKILQLKKKYNKKVIVMGEDTLASGAYLVASAADEIYVNRDTVTGSIGVIMNGFGFTDAIAKLGISRRVYTAGANKDRLDPFKPLNPADEAKVKIVLNQVYQNFVQDVKTGRGARLKGDPQQLFSGDFWSGTEAVKLGLADGTSNLWEVLKEKFSVEQYRDYTKKQSIFENVLKGVGTELGIGKLGEKTTLVKAEL